MFRAFVVAAALVLAMVGVGSAQDALVAGDDLEARLAGLEGRDRAVALIEIVPAMVRRDAVRSVELGVEALALARRHGDGDLVARADVALASCYEAIGSYDQARSAVESAIAHHRSRGQSAALARALDMLGKVLVAEGSFDLALASHLEALALYDDLGESVSPVDRASCLSARRVVAHRLGDLDRSVDFFQQALVIQEAAGGTTAVANTLNNIGVILKRRQRYDEALEHYRRALALRRQIGDTTGVADTLNNIALVHYDRGAYAESLVTLEQSLALRRQIGDPSNTALALGNIGEVARVMGDHRRSLDCLVQAAALSEGIGAKYVRQDILLQLATTQEVMGDHRAALATYKDFAALRDEIRSQQVSERVAELQSRFDLQEKENEIELLRRDQAAQRTVRNGLILLAGLLAAAAALVFRGRLLARRSAEVVRRSNRELEAVEHIVAVVNRENDLGSVLDSLLEQAVSSLAGADAAAFFVRVTASQRFRLAASRNHPPGLLDDLELSADEVRQRYLNEADQQFADIWVIRSARGRAGEASVAARGQAPASMLVLAVRVAGEVEGLLVLDSSARHDAFDDADAAFLRRLQGHILSAFTKARLLDTLQDVSDKKSEVLRIAAHDIRSPLASISAGLQTLGLRLARGAFDVDDARRRMAAMVDTARGAIDLLERLLDLSAIEAGCVAPECQVVDLAALLAGCERSHRSAAERKGIALETSLAEGLPAVSADPVRIAQVVDNLISNAVKYTFPGGWVRISSAGREHEVVVTVEDNGQGLGPDDLEQVFRSFKRLSAQPTAGETSNGLGLAIAKSIVELHHGRIWVESSQGRGSRFSFSLPVG